ncbi:uncharacterized protein MAM_04822 [Metarhizium album ARSEF 1941]|uniref:Uncharacterized protein n=1 Tax=Metarhizium album (strain ARSEF 1941) TaxID=1081103 RepID=A0A0B2WWH7_METAS|nr:uncharacterized protein MAM_04822 [Metarhizium album ARSEF 1941]KHN97225.1 hypothetical protein MAM_04822 [Metarhizium album ARSEF 1941]
MGNTTNKSPESGSHQSSRGATRAAPSSASDEAQDLPARIKALSESLRNSLPTSLLPDGLAEAFRQNSNQRLQLARERGVGLEEIYIAADGLPTWRTLYWDPEDESLHSAVQRSLVDLQLAQEMGEVLQRQIRDKSARRLRQALSLGIQLDDIVIGESLLPEWTAGEDDSRRRGSPVSVAGSTPSDSTCVGATPAVGSLDTNARRPPDAEDSVLLRDLIYGVFGGGDSDSDDSDDDDPGDIYMNNHVDARPVYDEHGHGHGHVVHGVEIVGGDGQNDVDLAVYVAFDDEDLEHLPAVELAIDRDAFELSFGDQDAVDVHIPDTEIFCFDTVEEYDDDGKDAHKRAPGSGPRHPMELRHHSYDEGDGIAGESATDVSEPAVADSLPDSEVPSEEE